jgi:hypothetical protein
MLKFTSVSGSVRAITDITLTGTIIRTGITITGRITGTADIVIIAIIITVTITGANLIGIATPGWLEIFSNQPNFLSGHSLKHIRPHETRRSIFLTFATGPVWQGFCQAHRAGTLFSTAESVPGFPFAAPFRFAAGAIVRLFGVPECTAIQTGRALVDSAEDRSRELRRPRRVS